MLKRYLLLVAGCFIISACQAQNATSPDNSNNQNSGDSTGTQEQQRIYYSRNQFVMGADLSYANEILDHGGTYSDSGAVENPYKIFSDYGTNVVRIRMWNDPEWTKEISNNDHMYNDFADAEKGIRKAKEQGMAVNLDLHFSDGWADPGTQEIPRAWKSIVDLKVLKDSVYKFTRRTLQTLKAQGLMPEYVQIGNETNCGMMFSNAPDGFPKLNVCDGNWVNLGSVINSGIKAVREVSADSDVDTKIILHIAQPENVEWWFQHMTNEGDVTDFDIIGFSYYSPWSKVALDDISDYVNSFHTKFNKTVMIVETAYPWTLEDADEYPNQFGKKSLVTGYPASPKGQRDYMIALVKEVIAGGGKGVMYWEPDWITSNMKDKWGTGSSWDNNTFFDFSGKIHKGIDYMTHQYEF